MLKICEDLFSLWNTSIEYCHWKGNEKKHLEKGLEGISDLDVLVNEKDCNLVKESLNSLGFIQCISQFGSRFDGVEDWVGLDIQTGKMVHLHLHYQMVTGLDGVKQFRLPWREEALASRVFDKEHSLYIMDPSLELITLYTRIGLKANEKTLFRARKNKLRFESCFKKDPTEDILYLKTRADWNRVNALLDYYYGQSSHEMRSLMENVSLDSDQFLRLYDITHKTIQSIYRRPTVHIKRIVYLFYSAIRHKLSSYIITRKRPIVSKNLTVCFLGQDGSGKSTITSDIEKWLRWKLEVKKFYLGSGDEFFNPWQKRLQKRVHKKNSFVAKTLRAWLPFSYQIASAKYVYRTIKRANRYASKGGIVLFDRYPQIQFAGINDGPKIRSLFHRVPKSLMWLAEWYAALEEQILTKAVSVSPTLIFKLMLSTNESMRRKPFEKREMVERKHEIIKSLQFPDSTIVVIDAEQPYLTELIEIKQEIWKKLLG